MMLEPQWLRIVIRWADNSTSTPFGVPVAVDVARAVAVTVAVPVAAFFFFLHRRMPSVSYPRRRMGRGTDRSFGAKPE